MTLLDALNLLTAKMADQGVSATYSNGQNSLAITVMPGPVQLQTAQDRVGVKIEVTDKDFITALPITIGGVDITPDKGHTITLTENSVLVRYTLQPIGTEKCARKIDNNSAWRLHTKYSGPVV